MNTSIYSLSVGTYVPMLKTLSQLLERAQAQIGQAAHKLVDAKLAPDMFTLAQQVQQACYYAANDASRLSGRGPQGFPAVGSTIDELRAALSETIDFVSAIPEADFQGADGRDCSIDIPNKMTIEMDGSRFLRSWSLPQFYFHVVTAYDIMRQSGIEIGKRDYVNLEPCPLNMAHIRPRRSSWRRLGV
jgi:hypothetical protein